MYLLHSLHYTYTYTDDEIQLSLLLNVIAKKIMWKMHAKRLRFPSTPIHREHCALKSCHRFPRDFGSHIYVSHSFMVFLLIKFGRSVRNGLISSFRIMHNAHRTTHTTYRTMTEIYLISVMEREMSSLPLLCAIISFILVCVNDAVKCLLALQFSVKTVPAQHTWK